MVTEDEWKASVQYSLISDEIERNFLKFEVRFPQWKTFWDRYKVSFMVDPASSEYHGAEPGGLAKHSQRVYLLFKNFCADHEELHVPEETIFLTGWFHDLCKVGLYQKEPPTTKSGEARKKLYKVNDNNPLGHGEKSVMLLQEYFKLTRDEQLIIRWHMNNFDYTYKEYAEKIKTICPAAVIFFTCDYQASILEDL